MMISNETKEEREHVILIAASANTENETENLIAELSELAKTAGADVDDILIQYSDKMNPGTYLGSGKVQELKQLLIKYNSTGIIADDELTPVQIKNLSDILDVKILDRTLLILDIFASHAVTKEGKIQVELASLNHRMSMLSGNGITLSRLGGGIGTRGPGENKLEQSRRVIRNRIGILRRELREIISQRETQRKQRKQNYIPSFAIVGYTNAGKSTLLNALTGSDINAEDKLFATLDTTIRKCLIKNKEEVLVADTVGFIRKLPHELVEAFKSTLEEAKYADYLIHVIDSSDDAYEEKMKTVYETLLQLGIEDKRIITVFNKIDLIDEDAFSGMNDRMATEKIYISAENKKGIDELKDKMSILIREDKKEIYEIIPYTKMPILNEIRKNGQLIEENYIEEGVCIHAYVPKYIIPELRNN